MVESEIGMLVRALEGGRQVPENILVRFGGAYLYFCRVAAESPRFADGYVARIGLIFLIPLENDRDGVRVRLLALRLASSRDGVRFERDRRRWEGHGNLSLEDGGLEIEYLLYDGDIKIAEEKVWPDGESGDWKGEFEAESAGGERIFGQVRHVLWANSSKLAAEFADTPVRYWELLDPATVGQWGRRIYATLPAQEQATKEEPIVLIDVVSGKHVRTSDSERRAAGLQLLDSNPHPVLYRAELAAPKRVSLGVGPIR
jgi:hypothetical protein